MPKPKAILVIHMGIRRYLLLSLLYKDQMELQQFHILGELLIERLILVEVRLLLEILVRFALELNSSIIMRRDIASHPPQRTLALDHVNDGPSEDVSANQVVKP